MTESPLLTDEQTKGVSYVVIAVKLVQSPSPDCLFLPPLHGTLGSADDYHELSWNEIALSRRRYLQFKRGDVHGIEVLT